MVSYGLCIRSSFKPGIVLHQVAWDWKWMSTRWPLGPECSFWSWEGFSCHHDSVTAGIYGGPSGCLAWLPTPCFSEPPIFFYGQGTIVYGDLPATPVELTWFPEVRMVKWVMNGSKKLREIGACWVSGSLSSCTCIVEVDNLSKVSLFPSVLL
jgi:hypothetical protein